MTTGFGKKVEKIFKIERFTPEKRSKYKALQNKKTPYAKKHKAMKRADERGRAIRKRVSGERPSARRSYFGFYIERFISWRVLERAASAARSFIQAPATVPF